MSSTPPRWDLYRILSEPVRLRLLALAEREELAIGEIAELLGESQPNVSRHAAPLKAMGLLAVRKEGTRVFVRLRVGKEDDPVVVDALTIGRSLCVADGSLARVADVLRARDAVARDYFAQAARDEERDAESIARPPREFGAYLAALAPLIPRRRLAVDAGTGDGSLLEVLSPIFTRVVALDRSPLQIERARARTSFRGLPNVTLVEGEIDGSEIREALEMTSKDGGADVVFAVRLLHHAAKPASVVEKLFDLCAPGGALVVVDYARHDDEAMRRQADLWLGFSAGELRKFARLAGFESSEVTPLAPAFVSGSSRGRAESSSPHGLPPAAGSDMHLPWQIMVARKGNAREESPRGARKVRTDHG